MQVSPKWAAVDAAFSRALDLDGAEREAFLVAQPDEVRAAVVPLLRDAARDFPLIDRPEDVVGPLKAGGPSAVREGARVGPYRIEGLVGEGGMGRVYRARRADGAFDRTVALKVVRQSLTLAGSDVAARLRRERALLATLDHPGIGRLLDGGETADGVPYLVTEFVHGAPITDWAEEHGLGVHDRVRLVIGVVRAVDYAHRRFVVHRDLKPSNVLVTERDGSPQPVVLDFGIAKLMDAAEGPGAVPLTRTGMRLLTPAYAAPELYEPSAPVTTAADVYGLGALLYETLTGHRPHDDTSGTGPPTTEPTRPSRVVTGAAHRPAPALTQRARALQGDLDTICLKALHPDPARRYASAADLADDLERHLAGEPVAARPDSLMYVAGRFARRHRTAVAAGLVTVLSLVVALAISVVSLRSERAAHAASDAAASRATDAAEMMAELFRAANPETSAGQDLLAVEALGNGLDRVSAVEDPALQAYLLGVLGETYAGIGDVLTADSLFAAGLAVAETLPEAGADLTRLRLGYAKTRSQLSDDARAIGLLREVVAQVPVDDPVGAEARRYLALSVGYADDLAEGDRLSRAFVAEAEASGDAGALVETLLGRLLLLVWVAEESEEAIPIGRRLLALSGPLLGPDHRTTRVASSALARAFSLAGRHPEAVVLYHDVLRANVRVHGPGSRDEAYVHVVLSDEYRKMGEYRAARDKMRFGIEMAEPYIGAGHQDIGWWLVSLAEVHNRLGESAEAERAGRRAVGIAGALASDALRARALAEHGLALARQRRPAAARVLRDAAEALRRPTGMAPSYDQAAAGRLRVVEARLAELGAPDGPRAGGVWVGRADRPGRR